MLAIARGLMSRPKLFILDETSLGLAPIMVKTVFEIVKTLNSEGVTVLLVEQNIHHALEASKGDMCLRPGASLLKGQAVNCLTITTSMRHIPGCSACDFTNNLF